MANDPSQNEEDISDALAKLAEMVKPMTIEPKISLDAFYYLLLLWASFHIYPLEPPPQINRTAKIIKLSTDWKALDYGDCISASPGEDYGTYCTGKLIAAAWEMVEILAQKGVTKVGFLGHDIARRAAWIACLEHNIEIINYEPSVFDWEIRQRVLEARKQGEKLRKKPPQVQG